MPHADDDGARREVADFVAIERGHTVVSNPSPSERLEPGDHVAVIGSPAEVADARRLLGGPEEVMESVES